MEQYSRNDDTKLIRISSELHELLAGMGTKKDTYQSIIYRIIEENKELKKKLEVQSLSSNLEGV